MLNINGRKSDEEITCHNYVKNVQNLEKYAIDFLY